MIAFGQRTQKYPYPTSSQPMLPGWQPTGAKISTREEQLVTIINLGLWLQIPGQNFTELS